jgi:hypothetical protein
MSLCLILINGTVELRGSGCKVPYTVNEETLGALSLAAFIVSYWPTAFYDKCIIFKQPMKTFGEAHREIGLE